MTAAAASTGPPPAGTDELTELRTNLACATYARDHGWSKGMLAYATTEVLRRGEVPSPETFAALAKRDH